MDATIAAILTLDGLTSGAIYALVALALVLVFAVTRVVFIPQGEFIAYGALTLALLQAGKVPGTVVLLVVLAGMAALADSVQAWRERRPLSAWLPGVVRRLAWPVGLAIMTGWLAGCDGGLWVNALLTLAIVTSLGPLLYRLAYRSLADASVLVLLIVSVGVHFVMTGLGLVFFGAEGYRNPSFWEARFELGPLSLSGQTVIIFAVSLALILGLWLFFERTLRGKALRATAINRTGARLMGISTDAAGSLSFTLAAFIGALSGLLIGPSITVVYDSGFLIGLKGFIGAVVGGLASFPLALVGALGVGLVEAFSSFWASAYKEVIVFAAILPVLLWRSFADPHREEH